MALLETDYFWLPLRVCAIYVSELFQEQEQSSRAA